jgi:mannosyltransferase OCH1-like enzyme
LIPKIVHQTWKGCSSSLPPKQAQWREACQRANPEWSFWLWNDVDNRQLIADHYPSFLATYDAYDTKMKQVDAARHFYLHRFGGIYMDLDFACLRPFEALAMPPQDAIFSHQYANIAAKDPRAGVAGTIANNFMVAEPGHPFFAYAIHKLPSKANRSLLFATGPNFLSRIISEYRETVKKLLGNDVPLAQAGHVTVYKMPKVYATGWKGKNTCDSGLPDEIERCSATAKATNGSVLATFWTQTWKYNADSMGKPRVSLNVTLSLNVSSA